MAATDESTLTLGDIKKPKSLGKKIGRVLLNGVGGASQPGLDRMMKMVFKNDLFRNIIEIFGAGTLGAIINNKWADSFFNGIVAGSSKDIAEQALAYFPKMGLPMPSTTKPLAVIGGNQGSVELQPDFF